MVSPADCKWLDGAVDGGRERSLCKVVVERSSDDAAPALEAAAGSKRGVRRVKELLTCMIIEM